MITRRIAEAGADLILCPSWGAMPNAKLMSQRSADNRVPTILVNPYEAVMTDAQGKVLLNVLEDRQFQEEDIICIQNVPIAADLVK